MYKKRNTFPYTFNSLFSWKTLFIVLFVSILNACVSNGDLADKAKILGTQSVYHCALNWQDNDCQCPEGTNASECQLRKSFNYDGILLGFEKSDKVGGCSNPKGNGLKDSAIAKLSPDNISHLKDRLDDNKKYFFLGEIKSKMDLYSSSESSIASTNDAEILDLEDKLIILTKSVIDTLEKRDLTIKLIEEIISEYIEASGTALENYASYKPVFNYADKALLLRKPKTSFIEPVGSSSNHMFLHLFFTLAMQEIAFQNKSPFVAPYLVIDQPSRPYYGDETKKKNLTHSDESKITKAFELLDKFIETRISNSGDFQMIVFEHVPRKIFAGLKNVHLVEEFYNGNALIPADMLNEE
jgi:hypothetical protein